MILSAYHSERIYAYEDALSSPSTETNTLWDPRAKKKMTTTSRSSTTTTIPDAATAGVTKEKCFIECNQACNEKQLQKLHYLG